MPITKRVRCGEAVTGLSASGDTDNNIAVYSLEPGTRLQKATCVASLNTGTVTAAQLNGRALVVVYVRQGEDNPLNPVFLGASVTFPLPGDHRIIGAAFVGDVRFGATPAEIDLDYIVQEGEQIVIECTSWRDSANTAGQSQSVLNLMGMQRGREAPNERLALRVK